MPSPYTRKPDLLYYDAATGRTMEHKGYATRIHWSKDMTDYLRRHFPTTTNEELAGCLGVSQRTMVRKARELGLEKDPQWLREIWDERRRIGQAVSRKRGNSGQFKKGERRNPDGEFKPGHRLTAEQEQKRSESMRRWYRLNPDKARQRAAKVWATRRKNEQANNESV